MGCGASSENNASGNSSKQQDTEAKVVHVTAPEYFNETITLKKANNAALENNNTSSDGNLISPQESLEVLIPKPTKPKNPGGKKSSMKSHERKSKELKQVQAWGKKTSTTETDFLEDLRTQRRENNPFYEQEYEISEVDETARFIDGGDSGMIIDDDSLSDISISDSSNQVLKIYKEGNQEESFDVSKIIDVEKFRAANVQGEKKDNNNSNDNSNGAGLSLKTKLTGESQRANRSHQDLQEETSNDDFYNEDDRHLIESIEKEFLITQDNFLPGQIVN